MSVRNDQVSYIPQLDGLRAFAVFLVLIWHWEPSDHVLNTLPTGLIGVNVFFVLSGFLITKILIKHKFTDNISHTIKSFVIRRALRIFPIYYLVIFATLFSPILSSEAIENHFEYFFFYLSNIYFYLKQGWEGIASHLWTLAVEEQFYLFWPFLVLFVPVKKLPYLFYLTIAIGVVSRYTIYLYGDVIGAGKEMYYILTPTCLDSFGLGALLSYLQFNHSSKNNYQSYLKYGAIFSSLIVFAGFWVKVLEVGNSEVFFDRFFISLIALYLIMIASERGFRGVIGMVLNNKFVLYIGKISYGIYLFHPFTHSIYKQLHFYAVEYNLRIPILNIILFPDFFAIHVVIVLVVSMLSWEYFEKPINAIKHKFTYANKKIITSAKA